MNRSFEVRTGVDNNNRRRLLRPEAPAGTVAQPDHYIRGHGAHRNERLTAYPTHYYGAEGEEESVEFRIGPMMYARNIQAAFDYYQEGIKFAAPRCSYRPYQDLATRHIEIIYMCASIAARGVLLDNMAGNEMYIQLCGNAFAVGLPDTSFYTEADSNRLVLMGIRWTVQHLDAEMRGIINEQLNNPAWNTPNTANDTPEAMIEPIIEILAVNLSGPNRIVMMNSYIGIFLAYTQQGNISTRKMQKVVEDLARNGINVTLAHDQIRTLWNVFGPYFDDDAAKVFFPYWERAFDGRSLRMQLILSQVANAGLTALTLIRHALATYPDFQWGLLASKCPVDWAAFRRADEMVGNDIYYGFKKDLGAVGVRNYKSIAYAAKKLHQEVMGDQNMITLLTLTNVQIAEAPYIDSLIQRFKEFKRRQEGEGDRNAVLDYYGANPPANFLAAEQLARANNPAQAAAFERLMEQFFNHVQAPAE